MRRRKAFSGEQTIGSPRALKAGIAFHRTPRRRLEGRDQRVTTGIGLGVDGPDPGGVVDTRRGGGHASVDLSRPLWPVRIGNVGDGEIIVSRPPDSRYRVV